MSTAQVSGWPAGHQLEDDDIYLGSRSQAWRDIYCQAWTDSSSLLPTYPGGVSAGGAQGRGRGGCGARAAPCQGTTCTTAVTLYRHHVTFSPARCTHPGRGALLFRDDERRGEFRRLHPEGADHLDQDQNSALRNA